MNINNKLDFLFSINDEIEELYKEEIKNFPTKYLSNSFEKSFYYIAIIIYFILSLLNVYGFFANYMGYFIFSINFIIISIIILFYFNKVNNYVIKNIEIEGINYNKNIHQHISKFRGIFKFLYYIDNDYFIYLQLTKRIKKYENYLNDLLCLYNINNKNNIGYFIQNSWSLTILFSLLVGVFVNMITNDMDIEKIFYMIVFFSLSMFVLNMIIYISSLLRINNDYKNFLKLINCLVRSC